MDPTALCLSDDAARRWKTFHDAIEDGMKASGRYACVKSWASKTPEQCLRIAGVLTLVEGDESSPVNSEMIRRASDIAQWHLEEAARLVETSAVSPAIRDAEALIEWAKTSGRTMLYSAIALRLGPSRIRERSRFVAAMTELERAGWAIRIDGGKVLDGAHRKSVWKIVVGDIDL